MAWLLLSQEATYAEAHGAPKETTMKKHGKILYGAFLAALIMAMPLAAQARPFGCGPGGYGPGGYGGGWSQPLPQEQRDAVAQIMREHHDKVQSVRDQLWIKSQTLDALSGNPKVEPKEIQSLAAEIAALRTQLRAEHKAVADRIKKETGLDMPGFGYGGGYGRGDCAGYDCGYGPGGGYGGRRGGGRHWGGGW